MYVRVFVCVLVCAVVALVFVDVDKEEKVIAYACCVTCVEVFVYMRGCDHVRVRVLNLACTSECAGVGVFDCVSDRGRGCACIYVYVRVPVRARMCVCVCVCVCE